MKSFKKMMLYLFIFIAVLLAGTYFFMQQEKFGKLPSGERLERIKKSPNWKDGAFQNQHKTPNFDEEATFYGVMWRFFTTKVEHKIPDQPFQFTKTDLKSLNPNEDVYIWMGHSSYYIQIDGLKILVDPVFSANASPVTFTTKAIPGSNLYQSEDFPNLDYLIISHDHWDHLDHKTVKEFQSKVKKVITGLGTGSHLEHWGFPTSQIVELDWSESFNLGNSAKITAEPARHFSGRGFKRNQTLWTSFVLEAQNNRIYIGGDSGYDTHFKEIGEKYGSFDLAILENGQYNQDWKYIHMLPGEQMKAMKDLNAKRMIPVHNSKFVLALHSWDEPLKKMDELNTEKLRILFPKMGEKTNWKNDSLVYKKWWEKVK